MPISLVQTGATISGSGLALSLNSTFRGTYDLQVEHWKPLQDMLLSEVPSTQLMENHFYRETRPYPGRWPRGTTRGTKGFKTIRWTTVNKDWSVGVGWHRNDLNDDLSRTLEQDVRETAGHWATMWMRVRAQIMESTTDADLLDSIPNAPDGASMFSATDGDGADRLGVSGGNIISGNGYANEAQILKSFFAAQTRWQRMLDTENQPLIDPSVFAQGFVIEYPPELEEVIQRAFQQAFHLQTIGATGATAGSSSQLAAAAVSSIVKDGKYNTKLFPNPWLSDTADWYIHLIGLQTKSVYRQIREGLNERILTMDTGDAHAIRTKEESIWWDTRDGYGVALPIQSLKVNET